MGEDVEERGKRVMDRSQYLAVALLAGYVLATVPPTEVGGVSQLQKKWTVNTSAVFAGITFGAGHQGCQTVWDVDGDGVNEIIFGTRRGDSKRLWCFDANQNLEWIYPPMDRDGLPGDPMSKVSLIDVDGDGGYELCLAGRGGKLHVLDGKGHIIWTWDNPNLGTSMAGPPQAYDVDGDGFVEFFVADEMGYVHRLNHEGQLVWSVPACGKAIADQPTIADIDRDGGSEVLVASYDWCIHCLDARTGWEEWRFNASSTVRMAPIVADVNKDSEYEALVWDDAGSLFCVSLFGAEIWNLTLPTPESRSPKLGQPIGDVDGDGSLEMAVVSDSGLYCIDIGGSSPVLEWEINVTRWTEEGRFGGAKAFASGWSGYTLMADIDSDGRQEFLWLVPFPMVTGAATGALEAYYYNPNVQSAARAENGGWWGDVDGDGISEWVCELNGKYHRQTQVYCLTSNGGFPAESPWPEYYHSAYPAEYQETQDWLKLKGAYSNSLWFPMDDLLLGGFLFLVARALARGSSHG